MRKNCSWIGLSIVAVATAFLILPRAELVRWPKDGNAQELLDEALRKRVIQAYPRVADRSASDWERTSLIRQWAWSHIPVTTARSQLFCCSPEYNWPQLSAGETFALFDQEDGGVWCGGAATALKRLYGLFGFEAWALNTGSREGRGSHVVTLVRIRHDSTERLVVQDAYFNLAIVDMRTREPLDYLEFVRRLAAEDHESIATDIPAEKDLGDWPRGLLPVEDRGDRSPSQVAAGPDFWVLQEAYTCRELTDGTLEFTSPRLLEKYVSRRCHNDRGDAIRDLAWLSEQGHPAEILYLFLYPLGVDGPNSETLMQAGVEAATRTAGKDKLLR